jgi:hypothetical protein
MTKKLNEDPDLAKRLSAATGHDCSQQSEVATLLLAAAIDANPTGVVLYQSTVPHRIAANLKAVEVSGETVREFRKTVDGILK